MSNKVSDAENQNAVPEQVDSPGVEPKSGESETVNPKHHKPKKEQPIDRKEPGSPFLLAAVSYMFVLILALLIFTMIRMWWV